MAAREIKSQIRAEINLKMQKRNVIQNTLLTRIDPSLRTNVIINTLRSIPKEIPDIEQIEFKKLFPVLLVKKETS